MLCGCERIEIDMENFVKGLALILLTLSGVAVLLHIISPFHAHTMTVIGSTGVLYVHSPWPIPLLNTRGG